ncbi:alpha-L-rhamnosidase [Streptomyces sp. V4I8]|uniref:family 78 glycoside hydrolase catalytic domain n=1 Tax=Streptomyces sp. V4I8 TaxID=3156469 RepID=UPI003517FDE5
MAAEAGLDRSAPFRVAVAGALDGLLDGASGAWQGTSARPWLGYDGPALKSREKRYWQVAAATESGHTVTSPVASFEVGLTSRAEWSAQWITAPPPAFPRESWDPCPYLRHAFDVDDRAAAAPSRLYITALGLYRVWLNGVELTADALYRPGWTDYRTRVHHQTYDCGPALRPGRNVLAVTLAKGWYAGRLGLMREPGFYGSHPALLAQLESGDGPNREVLTATGEHWRAAQGALLASDLLRGEVQDLRQEPEGWRAPGFDDGRWAAAELVAEPGAEVVPQPHEPITRFARHNGVLVHQHARGPTVFDFGQNLVGWTKLRTTCLPSVELIVRHGEILTPEKLVYRDNLRGAFQEDRYAVPDAGPHDLEPSFTMHGFRYAEVWGLPSAEPHGQSELLPTTEIEAVSVTGLPAQVGSFACSDERLNRLARMIEWTVRDNFLEVATDCPQRDERHGWLGDAGAIGQTAAYHFDLSAFLVKFTQDIADGQGPDGQIRNWAPVVPPADSRPGAPGWSDGYIRLVHLLVQRYGDLSAAARLFPSMRAFLAHIDRANPDGLRVNQVGADFGDWLSLPEREGLTPHTGYAYTGAYSTTPHPIHDTAHSYRSFVQLAEIAARLGEDAEAARLEQRAEQIRQAYRSAFVLPDGHIKDATQTAYAQAIGFGLLDVADAGLAAAHLRAEVERRGYLTTGIHGVQHVLPALARHGHAEYAVGLLLRQEMPSWLHMLASGGTTVWEKWDGIKPDGTLSTAEMNSFNHCALGSVGQFLFEGIAGLDAAALAWTGEVSIASLYPSALEWARASYLSPAGAIESSWRWSGDVIEHEIQVPGAATARVRAPSGGRLEVDGEERGAELVLGPGRHALRVIGLVRGLMPR